MSLKKNGFHQTLMILLRCFWNFRLIAFCHNVNEKWLPQLECWTAVIDRYLLMNDQDWATVNRISTYIFSHWSLVVAVGDCHGLVVEFTYMLLAYHHWSCELESRSWWWFFNDIPDFSTNKTDCHNITEILLKVALNTITIAIQYYHWVFMVFTLML